MTPPRLSVNVDHVATLRQARRASYPDPVEAAKVAEAAGAAGITVHLRSDRRHVQDDDVRRLRVTIRGKLNLEMAVTEEMLGIASAVRPQQVSLVPERPEEVTTEGGLDVVRHGDRVRLAIERLAPLDVAVSVFLDPDPAQLEALAGIAGVEGFELNTDAYTRASPEEAGEHLSRLATLAEEGHAAGLAVYAGHGLTTANVGPVARLPHVSELNIGHFLVSRAVIVGMDRAVREMLAAIGTGRD